jgi:hypothetical protein
MSTSPRTGPQQTDDDIIIEYFEISELMDAWVDGYNKNPPLF